MLKFDFYQRRSNGYRAPWWCRGSHLQTIMANFLRPRLMVRSLYRERIRAFDGGCQDVDWLRGCRDKPLVILLHGLGNSSRARYITTLLREIRLRNWQAAAFNGRSVAEKNHGGQTRDLDHLVNLILKRKIAPEIHLVGFSAGGNQVLKWLGEKGDGLPPQVRRAVTVSACCNIARVTRNLDRGLNRVLYTPRLLKDLKNAVLTKRPGFPFLKKERIRKVSRLREYDREVVAPLNGYESEKEYWKEASSAAHLPSIRRPALMIHAANDSFVPAADLPWEEMRAAAPYVRLLLTRDGGHMGFISGRNPFRPGLWLEKTILHFLETEQMDKKIAGKGFLPGNRVRPGYAARR